MRLIDANVLKAKILEERDKVPREIEPKYKNVLPPTHNAYSDYMIGGIRKALRCMENTPTVDPVKHGKWLKGVVKNEPYDFIGCSVCFTLAYWDTDYGQQLFDYCPYCGAKMDEVS